MRALVFVLLVGCAVRRPPVPPAHAANPSAPAGRLADAPPALRPGVVDYKDVPVMREDAPADAHQHHHPQ
jgi:hypothetical protein